MPTGTLISRPAQPASYTMGVFRGNKAVGVWGWPLIHLQPMLRFSGAVPPLPYILSWLGEGQLNIFTFFRLNIISQQCGWFIIAFFPSCFPTNNFVVVYVYNCYHFFYVNTVSQKLSRVFVSVNLLRSFGQSPASYRVGPGSVPV